MGGVRGSNLAQAQAIVTMLSRWRSEAGSRIEIRTVTRRQHWAMWRRILVATDGSERAQRAEACAAELAPREIELLYVYPQLRPSDARTYPGIPWHVRPAQIAPYVRERASQLLREAEARVRAVAGPGDVQVWSRFVASHDVAGMIVHEAERAGADFVVLGGRKHHSLPLVGGGICTVVLERSGRPVLLVR